MRFYGGGKEIHFEGWKTTKLGTKKKKEINHTENFSSQTI